MCGIAGTVNLEGLTAAERDALPRMAWVLSHRGPDGSGIEADPFAGLVHTRLSIIDVVGGRQPIGNETGSMWITFNGEIYNHHELRPWLESRGHRFQTRSDTETILHLYEEVGERSVDRLRGMFAFAIWDRQRRRLFLARDRVGIKPLYYSQAGNRLSFGSEIKPLLQTEGPAPGVDPEALLDYLTLLWIPAPRSIFTGIRKLPAGHTATFDDRGLHIRQYWDLETDAEPVADPRQKAEELRFRLREAVDSHREAEVPLGAFLSGGLDSSAVVSAMSGDGNGPVSTHAIGFDEDAFDELPQARAVAERFGTNHHEQVVRPDAVAVVDRLAWHHDEPFADPSSIPCFYLAEMTRRQVTVALSGDGGDENFAGYRLYRFHQAERKLRARLPLSWRRHTFGRLGKVWPQADWLPRPLRFRSTLGNLGCEDWEAMFRSRSFLEPMRARKLLAGGLRDRVAGYCPSQHFYDRAARCSMSDPLQRDLYLDFKLYLADDILTKVDRATMAFGLEARVPLLDHSFVEFAAGLPSDLKLRGATGKYLFKEALRPILGSAIVDRRKQGFSVPLDAWFRGPLRPLIEDTVFSTSARVGTFLDMRTLRRLWEGHVSGRRHAGPFLWAVLMLEHWARHFLQDQSATAFGAARNIGGRQLVGGSS